MIRFHKNAMRILLLHGSLLMAGNAWATLEQAFSTGDPSLLPADSTVIVDAAIAKIDAYQLRHNKILQGVYGKVEAINFAPGNRSQFINIVENETVFPLLNGNKNKTLAAYGFAGRARFAAFGSSPISSFNSGNNLSYEPPFKKVIGWLLSGIAGDISALSQVKNVALTNTGGSNTGISTWLKKFAPSWNTKVCNDSASISTCYQNQDLLIVSWESNASETADAEVMAAIKSHLALGKPLLYVHTWYEGTSRFSDLISQRLGFSLPYGGNYWDNDAASHANLSGMQSGGELFANVERLLKHFKNRDFSFNWANCADDRYCKDMPDLVSEFYSGAEAVKNLVNFWSINNIDVFAQAGRSLGKYLVLLGDKYRSAIDYPMSKGVTNDTTFLQALYADHAAYITRRINPAQTDLGTFSGQIPANLPTRNAVLRSTAKISKISSSSGYYAPPGRTITLTRKDNSSVKAYAHIGILRNGSAHIFATYDRPQFLWSSEIPLVTNKAVRITSPFGGIVFLSTESSATADTLTVAASGVLRQPIFTGANFDEFNANFASTPLNWAEIKLPAVQIHTRLDLMQQSIQDPLIAGNLSRLTKLTQAYLYKDIYELAGFVGENLTQPAKVTAFCTARNWDCTNPVIHGMANIQHINADRAYCGYGCSGNPYDQYWAFTPLGWGESHEIGHNLQKSRLKIYDSASTEVSNNIFPIHKWLKFNALPSETVKYGRNLNFKKTFDALQSAALTADPVESARQAIWVNGDVFQRLIFYWQMAMTSRNLTHLGDFGWDVFRLMYKHERLFNAALANDTAWSNGKASLGFGSYAARPSAITGNDFMLISMSYITGKDQRPFFDLWGVKYSAEAANQVANYGFAPVKKEFWVVNNEAAQFKEPLANPVLINGATPWPL